MVIGSFKEEYSNEMSVIQLIPDSAASASGIRHNVFIAFSVLIFVLTA